MAKIVSTEEFREEIKNGVTLVDFLQLGVDLVKC